MKRRFSSFFIFVMLLIGFSIFQSASADEMQIMQAKHFTEWVGQRSIASIFKANDNARAETAYHAFYAVYLELGNQFPISEIMKNDLYMAFIANKSGTPYAFTLFGRSSKELHSILYINDGHFEYGSSNFAANQAGWKKIQNSNAYKIPAKNMEHYLIQSGSQSSGNSDNHQAIVNTKSSPLSLRDQPDGKKIAQIPKGAQVTVLRVTDSWSYIDYQGKRGYVPSNYLK